MAGNHGSTQHRRGRRSIAGEPFGEEPGVEGIAGAGAVGRRDGAGGNLEPERRCAGRGGQQGRPARTPLDDRHRGKPQEPVGLGRAQECRCLGGVGEQQVGGGLADEPVRGRPPGRQQRGGRSEVQGHSGAGLAGKGQGARRSLTERGSEERVRREVHDAGTPEPRRPKVTGGQQVRRTAVGHEAPLPRSIHEHADAGGASPCRTNRPDRDAVPVEGGDERPARAIAPDGADQRGADPEPCQPARGAGGRAALVEPDGARHVRAVSQRPARRQDDVQREVAKNDGAAGTPSRRCDRRWHAAEDTPGPAYNGPTSSSPYHGSSAR